MTSTEYKTVSDSPAARSAEAVAIACDRVAPAWPLDRMAAVNPLWGFIDTPMPDVSKTLRAIRGSKLTMPRLWVRDRFLDRRMAEYHLQAAITEAGADVSAESLVAKLESEPADAPVRAKVTDLYRKEHIAGQRSLNEAIRDHISQFCARRFDDGQASLRTIEKQSLYPSYRAHMATDPKARLELEIDVRHAAPDLPEDAQVLIQTALTELHIPEDEWSTYLTALLFDVIGWASHCAYRRWIARLQGADEDQSLVDLLAIRLSWELLLYRIADPSFGAKWRQAVDAWTHVDERVEERETYDWLYQRALEMGYQEQVIGDLKVGLQTPRMDAPQAQVAMCIDVRSENYRQSLETVNPQIHTLGFAGFFGLAADYLPAGADVARPQLPGLLAPSLRVTDVAPEGASERGGDRLDWNATWTAFKNTASSGFSFVESIGLLYAGKLAGDSLGLSGPQKPAEHFGSTAASQLNKPRLTSKVTGEEISAVERADIAEGILRGMSLTKDFAPFVLLLGHGSATTNNPQAAGLDCGACCGQSGDVNARAVAALLNEAETRQILSQRGVVIPDETVFVPGLHNTTTDAVELMDLDEVPAGHRQGLTAMLGWLRAASDIARESRSQMFGQRIDGTERGAQNRASDWGQTRPEWGLAGNAAFIVAPREHTRGVNLNGRSFLHEYRHEEDPEYKILEGIMTAPMLVTHWINLQYYASTVDNEVFGSGNKTLHNVVGGHIGVFEGTGGDLRQGLAMQSVHDGKNWVHEPLRLSVFIEAPQHAIEGVVNKHEVVQMLIDNKWLYLLQINEKTGQVFRLAEGGIWKEQF